MSYGTVQLVQCSINPTRTHSEKGAKTEMRSFTKGEARSPPENINNTGSLYHQNKTTTSITQGIIIWMNLAN
jgi:hypothetical protein